MSGTSMDGLDCCYVDIEIDEEYKMNYEIIDFKTIDFNFKTYNLIKSTIGSFDKEKIQYCDNKLGTVFLEFVGILFLLLNSRAKTENSNEKSFFL